MSTRTDPAWHRLTSRTPGPAHRDSQGATIADAHGGEERESRTQGSEGGRKRRRGSYAGRRGVGV